MFENRWKCHIWIYLHLEFSTNFCPIDMSGNTDRPQASGYQKFAILNELLSKYSSLPDAMLNETFSLTIKHRGTESNEKGEKELEDSRVKNYNLL